MKAIKKITALITAVIMMVCCMCTGASAASDPVGEASNGVVFILSHFVGFCFCCLCHSKKPSAGIMSVSGLQVFT